MYRRRFLAVGIAAIAAPHRICAQQVRRIYRLAILHPAQSVAEMSPAGLRHFRSFSEELHSLGYVEGQNLVVERRSARGNVARADELAREVVGLKPDVIFAIGTRTVAALKALTTTTPIVAIAIDPVGQGFADSLARPGGNITGLSIDTGWELVQKHIALLKEVVPAASRMAFLMPQGAWEGRMSDPFREAARAMRVAVIGAPVRSPADESAVRSAFAGIVRDKADALYVIASGETFAHLRLIAQLAAEARLPTISQIRELAEAGSLMAYAIKLVDLYRRAAGYVNLVFKGANPAEIPIQQPNKFDLIVNVKAAKVLGLTIPESMLVAADEVIE